MNTVFKPVKPSLPSDEMARLHHAGFSLLPLGAGTDGKSPMLRFRGEPRIPLGRILAPMHRDGSTCYGIRLDGLAVIDCDEDSSALVRAMETRFGASPVHVKTPRGRHLYYRAAGNSFPNLRGEELPVDIKRGASSYVVGPGSMRPDGGIYEPVKGLLGVDSLPDIQCEQSATKTARFSKGGRNYALTVEAIQMVEAVDGPDELFGNLQFIRDDECEHPASMPDTELEKIAAWAWERRLEGKVFKGRDSEFRLHRLALDALKGQQYGSNAIALWVTLQSLHGHIPGKAFKLDHLAMRSAGHTDLSRRQFLSARRALENADLLEMANSHKAAHHSRSYRLKRIRPAMKSAANVSELPKAKGRGV